LSIAVFQLVGRVAHAAGCAWRFPEPDVAPIKAANTAERQHYLLLSRMLDVVQFRLRDVQYQLRF
jgi:hypothetical protein